MNEDETLAPETDLETDAPVRNPGEDDLPLEAATAPWKRILTGGNVMLAGLFGAGILCVYLLSLRGGPARASAQQLQMETRVDTVLTQLEADPLGQAEAGLLDVAQAFYLEARHRQIPLGSLNGNPFVFVPAAPEPLEFRSVEGATQEPNTAPENQKEADAVKAVAELRLQSVLTGAQNSTAMISNNLLTESQTIAGWTVSRIEARQVTLTWKQRTYVLKMSE